MEKAKLVRRSQRVAFYGVPVSDGEVTTKEQAEALLEKVEESYNVQQNGTLYNVNRWKEPDHIRKTVRGQRQSGF